MGFIASGVSSIVFKVLVSKGKVPGEEGVILSFAGHHRRRFWRHVLETFILHSRGQMNHAADDVFHQLGHWSSTEVFYGSGSGGICSGLS